MTNYETIETKNGTVLRKHPEGLHSTWKRITVEVLEAGQPRAYADSVYRARITCEGGTPSTCKDADLGFGFKYDACKMKDLVKMLVHYFDDEGKPMMPYLETLKCVAEDKFTAVWEACVIAPYTG